MVQSSHVQFTIESSIVEYGTCDDPSGHPMTVSPVAQNVTPVAQNFTHVRALPTQNQKLSSPLQKSRAHSTVEILQFTDVLAGDFLGNFYSTGGTQKNC